MRRIPFAIWVISGGLLYSALALAYLTIPFALAAGIMGLGGGALGPHVLRLYWWRCNAWGAVGGTLLGGTGALLQRAFYPGMIEWQDPKMHGGIKGVDHIARAGKSFTQLLDEAEICLAVPRHVVLQIHGLDTEIEPLGGRVGGLSRHGVSLAEDRRLAIDQEGRAGAGIDDDAFADDDTLERLQLDP